MSQRTATDFSRIDLEGSRYCNVALLLCASVLFVSVAVRPGVVSVGIAGMALALTAWMRSRSACKTLQVADGSTLVLELPGGSVLSGCPVSVRWGGHWVSLVLRVEHGPTRTLLLFGDQFRGDDFRCFRRWLRATLPDDARDAGAGWWDWRSRWSPGSRD